MVLMKGSRSDSSVRIRFFNLLTLNPACRGEVSRRARSVKSEALGAKTGTLEPSFQGTRYTMELMFMPAPTEAKTTLSPEHSL